MTKLKDIPIPPEVVEAVAKYDYKLRTDLCREVTGIHAPFWDELGPIAKEVSFIYARNLILAGLDAWPEMMEAVSAPLSERVLFDDHGKLDEIVTCGRGAHLERMDKNRWFLNLERADGSSIAVWIDGSVTLFEERSAPR